MLISKVLNARLVTYITCGKKTNQKTNQTKTKTKPAMKIKVIEDKDIFILK